MSADLHPGYSAADFIEKPDLLKGQGIGEGGTAESDSKHSCPISLHLLLIDVELAVEFT